MIKRVINEFDIHEVLLNFPEIVVGDAPITRVHHEFRESEKSRVDIIIESEDKHYIIEIKNRELTYDDIMQARRYILESKNRNVIGVIVGRSIKEELRRLAENLGLKVFIIGESIPRQLKICGVCKHPYPYHLKSCPKCESKIVELEIHF